MTRPALVYALIAAVVLSLLGALASAFDDPIGPFIPHTLRGDAPATLNPFDRVRIMAGSVNAFYLVLAALAATTIAVDDQLRRVARWIGLLAVIELACVVYVFAFDAIAGPRAGQGVDTVYEVLFESVVGVLALGVALWARRVRRAIPAASTPA